MSFHGGAFLALLNDFAPDRDDEYNVWHSVEHVPERLTVPGITSARRYVNRADERYPYFTLYDMESTATMLSAPYLNLFENPTPWSTTMRPSFGSFKRIPCKALFSNSDGVAGAIRLAQLEGPREPGTDVEANTKARPWPEVCARIGHLAGITGVHVGLQDLSLPGPPGVKAAEALSPAPTFVMLVEAQELKWLARHDDVMASLIETTMPDLNFTMQQDYTLMHLITQGRKP
jgi:hypothetical protein